MAKLKLCGPIRGDLPGGPAVSHFALLGGSKPATFLWVSLENPEFGASSWYSRGRVEGLRCLRIASTFPFSEAACFSAGQFGDNPTRPALCSASFNLEILH